MQCRVLSRVLAWLVLSSWLCAVSAANGESLTLATYNVQNYGSADRMTENGYRKDYPKPESEKHALRSVIQTLHADILVLQEVGSTAYLEELRRDLRAEGCDYAHSYLARAADDDRHLALLSRRELVSAETRDDLSFPYFGARERVKRGVLVAVVATSKGPLTLFAVHLKSRFTERPDDPQCLLRRTGEATAIRDAVLEQFPDPARARFVVLGDCNDGPTSRALERLQHRGKTIITSLLPAADSRGETWTYCYRKEDMYSRVDHILVSPALRPAIRGGKAAICDVAAVSTASDHRPVVVTIDLE